MKQKFLTFKDIIWLKNHFMIVKISALDIKVNYNDFVFGFSYRFLTVKLT